MRRVSPLYFESSLGGFSLWWDNAWHEATEVVAGTYSVALPALPAWSLAVFPLQSHPLQPSPGLSDRVPDSITLEGPGMHMVIGPEGIRQVDVSGRSLLAQPAGVVAFFQHPARFDAWELVAPEKRGSVPLTHEPLVVEANTPTHTVLRLTHHVAQSIIDEQMTWDATSGQLTSRLILHIDDRHLTIQYRLPTTLISDHASRETLWGTDSVVTTPHSPADAAQFEWVAHRWVDLSEPSLGLSLYNDTRFGHHVDGGTITITLATAPLFPDPTADERPAPVRLGIAVHRGPLDPARQLAEAHAFSAPTQIQEGTLVSQSPVIVAPIWGLPAQVALVSFKPAEDGTGDWVCQFGEMVGDSVRAYVEWGRPIQSVTRVDLVSEEGQDPVACDESGCWLEIAAHQVVVWRVVPRR